MSARIAAAGPLAPKRRIHSYQRAASARARLRRRRQMLRPPLEGDASRRCFRATPRTADVARGVRPASPRAATFSRRPTPSRQDHSSRHVSNADEAIRSGTRRASGRATCPRRASASSGSRGSSSTRRAARRARLPASAARCRRVPVLRADARGLLRVPRRGDPAANAVLDFAERSPRGTTRLHVSKNAAAAARRAVSVWRPCHASFRA